MPLQPSVNRRATCEKAATLRGQTSIFYVRQAGGIASRVPEHGVDRVKRSLRVPFKDDGFEARRQAARVRRPDASEQIASDAKVGTASAGSATAALGMA